MVTSWIQYRDLYTLICFQIGRRLRTVNWAKKRMVQQQSQGPSRSLPGSVGSVFLQHMIQPLAVLDGGASLTVLIDVPD